MMMPFALPSRPTAAVFALILIFGAVRYGANLTELEIHAWNNLCWTASSLFVALKCIRIDQSAKNGTRAWFFFGLAHFSFFAGMFVWSFYELVLGQLDPSPSLADAGILMAGLLFSLGLASVDLRSDRSGRGGPEIGSSPQSESGERLPSAKVQPRRILVAEDVTLTRDILRDVLLKQGHMPQFAENGAEAVDLVQKEPFDLVLMDVQMPIVDGPEATRRIRQLPGAVKDIPIVALSANVTARDRDEYLSVGMNDCLMKPINWKLLQATISRFGDDKLTESPLEGGARQEADIAPLVDQKVLEGLRASMTGAELASWIWRSVEDAGQSCEHIASFPSGSSERRRAAHSLKGAAGTFGLMRICQIAAAIEEETRHGGETEPLTGELRKAISATREELSRSRLVPGSESSL